MILRLSSAGHAADQAIAQPQEDQSHPGEPGDRQHQPGKPQHLGHPAVIGEDFQGARFAGRRRADLGQVDLVGDEPEGERGDQVDHQVVEEIRHPVRGQAEPEAEIEEEHRTDRQVGPGEEPVLGGGERMRSLEQDLGDDEPDQHRDQDQHGVLEEPHDPPAEERDQAEVQQRLLPLAVDAACQALDPSGLAPQECDGLAAFVAIDGAGGFDRILRKAGEVGARAVGGRRDVRTPGRLVGIEERLGVGIASGVAGPSPARFGEPIQVFLGELQPPDGAAGRHLPEECRDFTDLVEGGLDDRGAGFAAAGRRQRRHPIVGRAGQLDAPAPEVFQPILGLPGTTRGAGA